MLDPEKKVRILDAATAIFSRYGFKKSSVEEIASAAGVGKGTVYLAFDSKEDLFYQVLHREVRALSAEVAARIDPRTPADELLVTRTLAIWEALAQQPLLGDLILGRHDDVLPTWSEQLQELRAVMRHPIVEVLELGLRQGILRRDLDREAVAGMLLDLRVAALLQVEAAGRTSEEQHRLGLTALDVVLNGVLRRAE